MPNLMERAVNEINDLDPDIVICSGDLTTFGFKHEYAMAKGYLDQLACDAFVVIPGNHDSRNVGYVHFEDMFGERNSVLRARRRDRRRRRLDRARPRPRPDRPRPLPLDRGAVRRRADLKIFVLHHHLLPVPGTGRERNVVYDAGDCIECLQRAGVDLVLSGHKHVPYAWRLENLFVVNAGTVSSKRLRGKTRPCYNVIEVTDAPRGRLAQVPVPRAGADHPVLDRDPRVREVHDADRGRGDGEDVRALAICDGEHYAPVVRDALAALPYDVVALWLAGGTEKLRGGEDYGVPVVDSLEGAIAELGPELVVDLSDEPVLGPRERFRLASRVLALGLPYAGPDFRFDPPALRRFRCRRCRSSGPASASARPPSPATWRGCSRTTATWSWSRWAAAGRPSRRWPRCSRRSTPCSSSRARGGTRPRTTSRRPRSPVSSRSAAGAAAAASQGARRVERARGRGARCRTRARARGLRRQRRGDPTGRDRRPGARDQHEAAARGRDRLPQRVPDPRLRPRGGHGWARRAAGRRDPCGQGVAGRLGRAAAAPGRAGDRPTRRLLHRRRRRMHTRRSSGTCARSSAPRSCSSPATSPAARPCARTSRARATPRSTSSRSRRLRSTSSPRRRSSAGWRSCSPTTSWCRRRARPRHELIRLADQAIAREAVT